MQTFEGIVTSVKMNQTVAVTVSFSIQHPKYHKIIKRTTKLLAHNEIPDVQPGDKVQIVKTKPFSKSTHFVVAKILEKGKGTITSINLEEEKKKLSGKPTSPKTTNTPKEEAKTKETKPDEKPKVKVKKAAKKRASSRQADEMSSKRGVSS